MKAPSVLLLCVILSLLRTARTDAPVFDIDYALESIPDHSPRKVALLHMHNHAPFFGKLGALTLANKRRYAAKHQYEVASSSPQGVFGLWQSTCPEGQEPEPSCLTSDKSFKIDNRAPTFGKIKLAIHACRTRPNYWLLWSDADAMIVNQTIPLESIIDDRYDIMVSADWLMINAGILLFKCSEWTKSFLQRVYDARSFDQARALDQSALQHFFDTEPDMDKHLKTVPKYAINVYTEEYRPGDFLLHMAGKLYEATTDGATAIAHQFDALSVIDDIDDVRAFFNSQYLLNAYSGICLSPDTPDSQCKPNDERRKKLNEPLSHMSSPNRYRHVGLRYYWLGDWTDKHDIEGWNENIGIFDPSGVYLKATQNDSSQDTTESSDKSATTGTAQTSIKLESEAASHDEL